MCHLSSAPQIRYFLKCHSENGKLQLVALLAIVTLISWDRKKLSHSVQLLMPCIWLSVFPGLLPSFPALQSGEPRLLKHWDQSCRGSHRSPSPSSTNTWYCTHSHHGCLLFLFFILFFLEWIEGISVWWNASAVWLKLWFQIILVTQRMYTCFTLVFFFNSSQGF